MAAASKYIVLAHNYNNLQCCLLLFTSWGNSGGDRVVPVALATATVVVAMYNVVMDTLLRKVII